MTTRFDYSSLVHLLSRHSQSTQHYIARGSTCLHVEKCMHYWMEEKYTACTPCTNIRVNARKQAHQNISFVQSRVDARKQAHQNISFVQGWAMDAKHQPAGIFTCNWTCCGFFTCSKNRSVLASTSWKLTFIYLEI
jgi:hypothetical protein